MLVLIGSQASAVTINMTLGGAIEGDSWSSPGFGINTGPGGPTFDEMEFFITADGGAGPFDGDGLSSFTNGTWTSEVINPNYILATGAPTGALGFTIDFDGDIASTVEMDILVYTGGALLGGLTAVYQENPATGQNAWFQRTTFRLGEPYDRAPGNPIPEPTSALLYMTGVLLVGTAVRRVEAA